MLQALWTIWFGFLQKKSIRKFHACVPLTRGNHRVVDIGGKFATGDYDSGSKFVTPVSTAPAVLLELRISSRIFENNRNVTYETCRGAGADDLRNKPEVKNLQTLSL